MGVPNNISRVLDGYVRSPETAYAYSNYIPRRIINETNLLAKGSTTLFGLCIDNGGTIYVSDPDTHAIYKSTTNRVTLGDAAANINNGGLSLYAGLPGTSGHNHGNTVSLANARFNAPRGLACDQYGNLYVADTGNNQIRKITPDGFVSLLAGDPNSVPGYVNGTSARFWGPRDLAVDASLNIYVADTNNNCIRKIRAGQQNVITIAGTNNPGDVLGAGNVARFGSVVSIAVDPTGNCFIADDTWHKVKKMNPEGYVTLLSGSGVRGTNVGKTVAYNATQFLDMLTITTDRSGNVYLLDNDEVFGPRMIKIVYTGTATTVYNFDQAFQTPDRGVDVPAVHFVVGLDVDRSGKFVIIESRFVDVYSSSSSSTQTLSSASSVSTSSSTVLLSRSSLSSQSTQSSSSSSTELISRSSLSSDSSSTVEVSRSSLSSVSTQSSASTGSESSTSATSGSSSSVLLSRSSGSSDSSISLQSRSSDSSDSSSSETSNR